MAEKGRSVLQEGKPDVLLESQKFVTATCHVPLSAERTTSASLRSTMRLSIKAKGFCVIITDRRDGSCRETDEEPHARVTCLLSLVIEILDMRLVRLVLLKRTPPNCCSQTSPRCSIVCSISFVKTFETWSLAIIRATSSAEYRALRISGGDPLGSVVFPGSRVHGVRRMVQASRTPSAPGWIERSFTTDAMLEVVHPALLRLVFIFGITAMLHSDTTEVHSLSLYLRMFGTYPDRSPLENMTAKQMTQNTLVNRGNSLYPTNNNVDALLVNKNWHNSTNYSSVGRVVPCDVTLCFTLSNRLASSLHFISSVCKVSRWTKNWSCSCGTRDLQMAVRSHAWTRPTARTRAATPHVNISRGSVKQVQVVLTVAILVQANLAQDPKQFVDCFEFVRFAWSLFHFCTWRHGDITQHHGLDVDSSKQARSHVPLTYFPGGRARYATECRHCAAQETHAQTMQPQFAAQRCSAAQRMSPWKPYHDTHWILVIFCTKKHSVQTPHSGVRTHKVVVLDQ